jgi:GNAT superfamily N-acetyltransferase
MRGNGIGKLIFERVVSEMKEKGFNGMVWQVLEWNEPAINFYNKYNAQFDKGWINCQIMK